MWRGTGTWVVDAFVITVRSVGLILHTYSLEAKGRSATIEAGSDPGGHLWVTWGVYLCAGKPPLADIILSHPPDLT